MNSRKVKKEQKSDLLKQFVESLNVTPTKDLPKDVLVILAMLEDLNIDRTDSQVVFALLDFVQKRVSGTLENARIYANHARKKFLDLDDVRLANEFDNDQSFILQPPQELLKVECSLLPLLHLASLEAALSSHCKIPPFENCELCVFLVDKANLLSDKKMPDVDIAVSNWSDVLLKKAYQFYANTNFCDLTLEFSDRVQMKVHRLILNTCTNFFQKIEDQYQQSDGTVASNIIVMLPAEISFHSLQPIITFLYTGKLKFLHNDFEEVYSTAKLMKMDAIIQILEHQKREFTKTGVLSNSFSLTNNRNGGRKRKSAATGTAAFAARCPAAAGNDIFDLESNAAPPPKRIAGSKSHSLPLYRGKTLPPKPCRLDVPNTLIDYPFSDIKCEDIILKKPTHSDIFDKTKQSKVTVEKIGLTHSEIMKKIEKVNESLQKDSFLEDDEIVTINDLGNDHENDDDDDDDRDGNGNENEKGIRRQNGGTTNIDAEINNNAEKEASNSTNRSVNFTEIQEFAQELKLRNQQLIANEKHKSEERKKLETAAPTTTTTRVEKESGESLNGSEIIRSLPILDSIDDNDLLVGDGAAPENSEKQKNEVPEKKQQQQQQQQQQQESCDSVNKTISKAYVAGESTLVTSLSDSKVTACTDEQEAERAEILIAAVEKLQNLPNSPKKTMLATVAAAVVSEPVTLVRPEASGALGASGTLETSKTKTAEVLPTTQTETLAPESSPAKKSKVDVRSTRRSTAIAAAIAAGAATASGSKKKVKQTPKSAAKPKSSPKTKSTNSRLDTSAESSISATKKPKLAKTKPSSAKKTENGKTKTARSKAAIAIGAKSAVDTPIASSTPVPRKSAATAATAITSKPPSQPIPKQTRTAGYHCKECQLDITSYAEFRTHWRDIHTKSQNSFVCSLCNFESDRQILHAYHQYVRHGMEPKTASASSSDQSPVTLLYNFPKCSICSFVAMTEPQMNRHRLKHYSLQVQCLHCKTFFTSEHNFAVHLQLEQHNSPMHKLYICTYCGKDFIDESNLQTHLKFLHKEELVKDSLQYTDKEKTD